MTNNLTGLTYVKHSLIDIINKITISSLSIAVEINLYL